ncbi:hypothetical protein HHK36_019818 [Tetracentron sinense]|uniref:RING-type domain-containing protein n=1 Tax=Tetracentron sinense TaxID=13715 RepID=A0A835CXN6_TETSI|nr:hypothetical protein HHK36_032436 [Tetracentron sinense]KAF8395863.1 hypothetical protein HHK36_019818 [Tetracentron sinense]
MNWTQQMEVRYINTGFPYTITESLMGLFEGLAYTQADFTLAEAMHDQESSYWSMHMSAYKFGLPDPGSTTYYGHNHAYEVNDHLSGTDRGRRDWENCATMNYEEPTRSDMQLEGNGNTITHASPEQRIRSHHNASNSQVIWQDNIDLDNMTYEELLDLGEAVGTQSRGLSQELISSLPISKFKSGFFSRKKSQGERCVICQMEYKKSERQITLPCKHVYHAGCGTRWLSINKACPICYTEVFGEESRH